MKIHSKSIIINILVHRSTGFFLYIWVLVMIIKVCCYNRQTLKSQRLKIVMVHVLIPQCSMWIRQPFAISYHLLEHVASSVKLENEEGGMEELILKGVFEANFLRYPVILKTNFLGYPVILSCVLHCMWKIIYRNYLRNTVKGCPSRKK